MSESWSNRCKSTDPMLTMEELAELVADIKKKPVPVRIEAGTRMHAFIMANLPQADPTVIPFSFGLPILLLDEMASELALVRDQNGRVMQWFLLRDGEDGTKILMLKHPEPFQYEFQRTLPTTVDRPGIPCLVGPYASFFAYRGYGEIRSKVVWMEPSGTGTEDESEPREDQTG